MTRYLSFRFDDGFFVGALKANLLLAPNHGTFFVVTGLVDGTQDLSHIPEFVGQEFGSLESWRLLARAGHDVQPHSVTHSDLSKLPLDKQAFEIEASLALVSQVHGGPYVFCFPYNLRIDFDFCRSGFGGAGFLGSRQAILFNDVSAISPFELRSHMAREERFDWTIEQLRDHIPDNAWVILGFHSFDGEGWRPWSFDSFRQLVDAVRVLGYEIETISKMLSRFVSRPTGG